MKDNVTTLTPTKPEDTGLVPDQSAMEILLKRAAIAGALAFLTTMVTGLTKYSG